MERLKNARCLTGALWLALGLVPCLDCVVFAHVQPGDVIDRTNWQKLEGLVPESVLNWVKKGDFTLEIGKLNYQTEEYFPPFQMKIFQAGIERYGGVQKLCK